jgi:hypothetical protein
VSLRLLVGVLRGFRVALQSRAVDASPDYARACAHVARDVGAFLEYLTKRKEP